MKDYSLEPGSMLNVDNIKSSPRKHLRAERVLRYRCLSMPNIKKSKLSADRF